MDSGGGCLDFCQPQASLADDDHAVPGIIGYPTASIMQHSPRPKKPQMNEHPDQDKSVTVHVSHC